MTKTNTRVSIAAIAAALTLGLSAPAFAGDFGGFLEGFNISAWGNQQVDIAAGAQGDVAETWAADSKTFDVNGWMNLRRDGCGDPNCGDNVAGLDIDASMTGESGGYAHSSSSDGTPAVSLVANRNQFLMNFGGSITPVMSAPPPPPSGGHGH